MIESTSTKLHVWWLSKIEKFFLSSYVGIEIFMNLQSFLHEAGWKIWNISCGGNIYMDRKSFELGP